MMNLKKILITTLILIGSTSIWGNQLEASTCFRKKKKVEKKVVAPKSDFDKAIEGAIKQEGLFTTYFTKKHKLYFAIPDSAYSRDYALSSRVSSTSNTQEVVAGEVTTRPFLIRWSTDSINVYLRKGQQGIMVRPGDPITPSFKKNMVDPILQSFPIIARKGDKVLIDVTEFFRTDTKSISPLTELPPGMVMPWVIKGQFVSSSSLLSYVKTFPKNIEIQGSMTFITQPYQNPYTLGMHRSITLLPKEPMQMRLQDNRVGFFNSPMSLFTSNKDKIEEFNFIHRWRLEPKDLEAYKRGELVEPVKPIIYYVDTAFPPKWRPTIRQAIEDWQKAFEKAGFKNAIIAKDYPSKAEDPNFDPDDINYSCICYATTETANAMGPSYIDPRSGEIIASNVIWYHNVLSLVHNWRFVQTAAVDLAARSIVFPDSLMCQALRYVAAHEVGHTLGLMHNMGASFAFTVENLRSPEFTQKYGTTPSIMDYARNNYVAQPGDLERGVSLTPPILGVYDIYAINWGYRLIPEAHSAKEELPILRKWIAEKEHDPMYRFGAQQAPYTIDPTDQTEDLSNNQFLAGELSIKNLKIIAKNIFKWEEQKGDNYNEIVDLYYNLIQQYLRHIGHIQPYIGGIVFTENRQGDNLQAYEFIPKNKQKEAVDWLLKQARSFSPWLFNTENINRMNFKNASRMEMHILRNAIISGLYDPRKLNRIAQGEIAKENKAPYKLSDYINDLTNSVFVASKSGRKLSRIDKVIESHAISIMGKLANIHTETKNAKALMIDVVEEFDNSKKHLPCALGACQEKVSDAQNSFFRSTMMEQPIDTELIAPLMMQKLKEIKALYKTRVQSGTADQKAYYNYQILMINKLLDPK